jgi:hypothetical protein
MASPESGHGLGDKLRAMSGGSILHGFRHVSEIRPIYGQFRRRLGQATDPLLSTGVRGRPCQCHPLSQKTRSWISIVLTLAAKAVANIVVYDWLMIPASWL